MPRWAALVLSTACGRVGFDALDVHDATQGPGVAWQRVFVAAGSGGLGASFTFAARAGTSGDVILLHTGCGAATMPASVTVTAPGWMVTEIAPIVARNETFAATFYAIAPDTAMATFQLTWNQICPNQYVLGDEFSAGASVDAQDQAGGSGDCSTTLVTNHADDTIWAACSINGAIAAAGAGYTKSGDDQLGDASEYKLTTDPSGTIETATFKAATGATDNVITAVALSRL